MVKGETKMKQRRKRTKGKVNHKKRVRFCCLDYYRTIVTGEVTNIDGITQYFCNDNEIHVLFDNGFIRVYPVNEGERQLKEVIKAINAYLGGNSDGAQ